MFLSDPIGEITRWAFILQGYEFSNQYRPGKDHGNVDTLSRRLYTISQQSITRESYRKAHCTIIE